MNPDYFLRFSSKDQTGQPITIRSSRIYPECNNSSSYWQGYPLVTNSSNVWPTEYAKVKKEQRTRFRYKRS